MCLGNATKADDLYRQVESFRIPEKNEKSPRLLRFLGIWPDSRAKLGRGVIGEGKECLHGTGHPVVTASMICEHCVAVLFDICDDFRSLYT